MKRKTGCFLSTMAFICAGMTNPRMAVGTAAPADEVATVNGDVNASGRVDLSDALYLLQYLFQGGPAPTPLACEPGVPFLNGDVNGSGTIDIADPICLCAWLFSGGPLSRGECSPFPV
jgi:hypothetical protein